MAKSFKSYGSIWVLVLLLLVGGLAGSAAGNALAPAVPWLRAASVIGLEPSTLDLHFFKLTFGFTIALGPLTALGLIIGYLAYRRL
ncbi:MAG: DUF4321 domain-containing protein [Pelotomaculum sp.]|uniref:DUF4321 domain-containing protein n=1 Tax=Pelotomaculum thermopropionicum (strain DSM 13744 / JCM 10971 / SI) TaxID=370438 RepID=A5D425_PELTS|nr:DUF4321 domain-containing protein [Pelotomaculum sp.]BAF58995.1 hypothetical protein PTH_0814 [Pelotomaculum thermopropionicum SI]